MKRENYFKILSPLHSIDKSNELTDLINQNTDSIKQSGNLKESFRILYKNSFVELYHYAKKWVDNTQTAEDITIESFMKLWERFDQFEKASECRAFLFAVVRNACINEMRRVKRAQERESVFFLEEKRIENEAEISGAVFQMIYDKIENLPPQERMVFKLSYLEQKTNEEIASILQINNQSVRNYKARALKTLRHFFKDTSLYAFFLWMV